VLVGCAPGVNKLEKVPNASGEVAGFWLGVWHGMTTPVTFAVSLFSDEVAIYEVHNSGAWYDLGFLLGLSGFLGGGGSAASRRREV
jgi:hypothetical protein